ncbi:unnamed protein product [Aphanomyces euteiches]
MADFVSRVDSLASIRHTKAVPVCDDIALSPAGDNNNEPATPPQSPSKLKKPAKHPPPAPKRRPRTYSPRRASALAALGGPWDNEESDFSPTADEIATSLRTHEEAWQRVKRSS